MPQRLRWQTRAGVHYCSTSPDLPTFAHELGHVAEMGTYGHAPQCHALCMSMLKADALSPCAMQSLFAAQGSSRILAMEPTCCQLPAAGLVHRAKHMPWPLQARFRVSHTSSAAGS